MTKSTTSSVILVDDDYQRRSSLETVLQFLKVPHRVMSFVDLLQATENGGSYGIALVGRSALPLSLNKLLQSFLHQFDSTPVCLLERWEDNEKLSDSSKTQLLRILDRHIDDELLTDLLHEAQVFRERHVEKDAEDEQFPLLIGNSPAMDKLKRVMARVVDRDVNVMINGESGTGKELVARSLHNVSSRAKAPFVPVNCGAIPPELVESELFGHEKGAFTGAVSSRPGRFEMANGGTLFLDEIGDMPLPMQVKLLRVLQERSFERVGGTKTSEVDVRIVAATHKNLETMIEANQFREALYYRLNVYPIETPPLRDRKADIELLLRTFADRAEEQGLGRLRFHPGAVGSLQRHSWPGNVRELSNLIERLAIMYPDGVIGVSELPSKCRHIDEPNPVRYQVQGNMQLAEADDHHFISVLNDQMLNQPMAERDANQLPEQGLDLKKHLEGIERALIEQALERCQHVVARAAALLQIRRTTLVEKMRKYGINRK